MNISIVDEMPISSPLRGFTLIEMSIVLVIVGLVAGGALVGHDLIKSAQLRALASQIEKYDAAVNTFREKYNCLPGDCIHATDFFPANPLQGCGVPFLGGTWPVPLTYTCNGDGDGIIMNHCTAYGEVPCSEGIYMWVDLYLAGLTTTLMNFGSPNAHPDEIPGASVPSIGLHPNAGISLYYFPSDSMFGWPDVSPGPGYNWAIGEPDGSQVLNAWGLSPYEAQSLDSKIDDGNALSGKMRSNTGGECASIAGIYQADIDQLAEGSNWWLSYGCHSYIHASF